MLAVSGVTLAFGPTEAAGGDACLKHLADDLLVRVSSADGQHREGIADVCTIQIEANALAQLRDHLRREAPVSTRRAGLST
jgi:hypothetical protein